MMRRCLVTSILYLIISATAFSQTVTTKVQRVYTTQKVNLGETIAIDGLLTDLAWNSVPWASYLTLIMGKNLVNQQSLRLHMMKNFFMWVFTVMIVYLLR